MLSTYLLGFGTVWLSVALACVAFACRRRFHHDWDRAFVKELTPDRLELTRELGRLTGEYRPQ
jgi:hypothetical protein